MLRVEGLKSGYGKAEVLHGLDFAMGEGEVLALLGRNGMGKSTTLMTLMGILPAREGRIEIAGRDVTRAGPPAIARMGVGYVPEGRRIFPNLTAEENLRAVDAGGAWTVGNVLELFPALRPRIRAMGNLLSGGEQQMLAIGRALMTAPRLLILDEATEGLAPVIRHTIWDALTKLAGEGLAILVVDKNLDQLLPLAHRMIVLERGRIEWSGGRDAAMAEREEIERLISVH